MLVPGSANPLLLKSAAAAGGYQISRSLRFNASDSGYLSRSVTSASNRKTWTFSAWIKRCALSPQTGLFAAGSDASNISVIYLNADGTIWYYDYVSGSFTTLIKTTAVYRDFSAWMHIVVAVDTTQGTAANRVRIYVNGSEVTAFSTATYPGPSADTFINSATTHTINRESNFYANYGNMYVADAYLIDGQQLTPSSFGETDATTGVWNPKAYTGTYTGNSFHLEFADNSSNTATTLGKDTSGLSNNWTPNNLSVTAGAGNDSLVDVPTNGAQTDTGVGGEVRGNYCTWNPLFSAGTLTNGNLDAAGPSNDWHISRATIGLPASGKYYWEVTVNSSSGVYGIGLATSAAANAASSGVNVGTGYYEVAYYTGSNISKVVNGSATQISSTTWSSGDVIMIAHDASNSKTWFGCNGTWYPPTNGGTAGNPAAGTNETLTTAGTVFPSVHTYGTGAVVNANWGQRAFAYTAPSGFKALCTANLPGTTITTSGTYTGNGVADGPFVYLNGVPTAMTIGGNAVTFGTHADKLSNGFKIRTTSTTYNQNANTYSYSITTTGAAFKYSRAQPNP